MGNTAASDFGGDFSLDVSVRPRSRELPADARVLAAPPASPAARQAQPGVAAPVVSAPGSTGGVAAPAAARTVVSPPPPGVARPPAPVAPKLPAAASPSHVVPRAAPGAGRAGSAAPLQRTPVGPDTAQTDATRLVPVAAPRSPVHAKGAAGPGAFPGPRVQARIAVDGARADRAAEAPSGSPRLATANASATAAARRLGSGSTSPAPEASKSGGRRWGWMAARFALAFAVVTGTVVYADRAFVSFTSRLSPATDPASSMAAVADAPTNSELESVRTATDVAPSATALARFAAEVARASALGGAVVTETEGAETETETSASAPEPVPVEPVVPGTARSPVMAAVAVPPPAWTEEAVATSVGFLAALHAKDCGFVSRRVAFPAEMDGNPVRGVDDLIPAAACDAAAADARPLAVLEANGLRPVGVRSVSFAEWRVEGPSARMAALGARDDDLVVTLHFVRAGQALEATLLMTGGEAGAMVKGYWD